MKRRLNPVIVGAFVLIGLLLSLLALISFGAGGLFSDPYRFVVYINDSSVSGLDPGSSVKLSGVRIGRVESVSARHDRASESIVVRVVADVNEDAARTLLGLGSQSPDELMPELILDGLRAKLNFSGITGMLYMDLALDKTSGDQPAQVTYEKETGYPIVPMAPSDLAEFTEALSTIASGLSHVDYNGISAELLKVLRTANATLDGLELKPLVTRIESAAGAVEHLVTDPQLQTSLTQLGTTLEQLQALIATWREAMPGLQEDAARVFDSAEAALGELRQTAVVATGLLQSRRELPDELSAALTSMQRAADAIQRLADYLERNPSAIIRGRGNGGTSFGE